MIQGIFYARFLPMEGTKIIAQSPPGCVALVEGLDKQPLFDFAVMQEYIIPRNAFFNRYITATAPDGRHVVLGFPVCIFHPKYERNEFIFNFGLVVEADVDQIPYERVVRRLAVTFAELEKQNEYLSGREGRGGATAGVGGGGGGGAPVLGMGPGKAPVHPSQLQHQYHHLQQRQHHRRHLDPRDEPVRPIESLLEIVKEDLNNYGECMVPVDDANTLNMKLFPFHPPPPTVESWHVPVAKMRFGLSPLDAIMGGLVVGGGGGAGDEHGSRGGGSVGARGFASASTLPGGVGSGGGQHAHHHHAATISADGAGGAATDPTWDLTLARVAGRIDGVSDVRRIAWSADVSLALAKAAVRHLLYYDTVLLLDMFFFGSCYAPRPGMRDFIANVDGIVDECAAYVGVGPAGYGVVDGGISGLAPSGLAPMAGAGGAAGAGHDHGHHSYQHNRHMHAGHHAEGDSDSDSDSYHHHHGQHRHRYRHEGGGMHASASTLDGGGPGTAGPGHYHYLLIRLMTTFAPGRSLFEWLKMHLDSGADVLRLVDVRRLVQFGVVKGLLYRVHKYVVSRQYLVALATGRVPTRLVREEEEEEGGDDEDDEGGEGGASAEDGEVEGDGAEGRKQNGKGGKKGKTTKTKSNKKGKGKGNMSEINDDESDDDKPTSKSGRNGKAKSHAKGDVRSKKPRRDGELAGSVPGHRAASSGSGSEAGRAAAVEGGDDADDSSGDEQRYGPEEGETAMTEAELLRYMDGTHHFDQIVTELNNSDGRATERFRTVTRGKGGMDVFYR